jgi:ribosomal protein L11 methyltransferase
MSSGSRSTLAAHLQCGEQTAHDVAEAIAERFSPAHVAISLTDAGAGRWQVALYFRAAADKDAVRAAVAAAAGPKLGAAIAFARIKPTDWVRESLAGLQPVVAGRFVVHGAHDRDRVPENRIGIEIEAALAFGTGHHGTTRGCLIALDRICKSWSRQDPVIRHLEVRAKRASKDRRPTPFEGRAARGHLRVTKSARVLDLGTGSGVLAIAAARALRRRVIATDIDAGAVRVAHANARLNRAGGLIEVVKADGVTARALRAHAPFDLIFANILLGPLQRIAAPLVRLTHPGARVVLSGLLPVQANAVIAAYRPLALERRLDLDGWTTLVFRRGTRRTVAPLPRPPRAQSFQMNRLALYHFGRA